jgi:trafficking protein particle complex subunit 12
LSASEIFSLFYTRLACLTLIGSAVFAAEESKALEDLNSPFYRDEDTHLHLIPWELRVLAVRLQGIGYGDPRRAISGYYDLARDARGEIRKASGEEYHMWKERLEDLGLRVGNALIEMGDLPGAIRHSKSLRVNENHKVLMGRLAMLYIQLGDLAAAKRCIEVAEGANSGGIPCAALQPLLSMAEGRYEDAVNEWKVTLAHSNRILATHNLAVCLLYAGRMEEVCHLNSFPCPCLVYLLTYSHSPEQTTPLLTSLISAGHSFHALTFNLATVYELCTEKARAKKLELVADIAVGMEKREDLAGRGGRGERLSSDFKL